jgi:hypothetical protein
MSNSVLKKSIVCWLWNDANLSGRPFLPENVNTLQRSIERHSSEQFRFICISDVTKGFDSKVEVIPTPKEALLVARHRSPEGGRFPSCYRRLWMFSEDAKILGERVLLIDIDIVPTNDWTPLFSRTEDFVGWRPYRDWGRQLRFGGGIYLMTPGKRCHVWSGFQGAPSIRKARAAGYRGSDQAWLSYCLGSKEPYFGRDAGIYSIRDFSKDTSKFPADARLVQFNGPVKPWQSTLPWVREHFR